MSLPATLGTNLGAIRFVRAASFSAAHRYFAPGMSEDENRRMYGSLYRKDGFGHNFVIEAHFEGEVDPLTGMIVNLVDVDRWLGELKEELDHRHLNEIPAFADLSPTPERIAEYCFRELSEKIGAHSTTARLHKVRLYEGDTFWVDYFE